MPAILVRRSVAQTNPDLSLDRCGDAAAMASWLETALPEPIDKVLVSGTAFLAGL
jgi:hypothetical protein